MKTLKRKYFDTFEKLNQEKFEKSEYLNVDDTDREDKAVPEAALSIRQLISYQLQGLPIKRVPMQYTDTEAFKGDMVDEMEHTKKLAEAIHQKETMRRKSFRDEKERFDKAKQDEEAKNFEMSKKAEEKEKVKTDEKTK